MIITIAMYIIIIITFVFNPWDLYYQGYKNMKNNNNGDNNLIKIKGLLSVFVGQTVVGIDLKVNFFMFRTC